MRTTLTLDDDLARRLHALARREGRSFKAVVNDAIRRGLAAQEVAEAAEPYHVDAFRSGLRAGIDPLRLNQLVDELETERAAGAAADAAAGRDQR
ncbi:MAG TPA: CopG family transcriptional regulator [Thermoanaerobaculia bacterium]|nr:CopG family transcriptional regulator [Thermoanaerobaculia bacterium]